VHNFLITNIFVGFFNINLPLTHLVAVIILIKVFAFVRQQGITKTAIFFRKNGPDACRIIRRGKRRGFFIFVFLFPNPATPANQYQVSFADIENT